LCPACHDVERRLAYAGCENTFSHISLGFARRQHQNGTCKASPECLGQSC
jgi:hypothetical protein